MTMAQLLRAFPDDDLKARQFRDNIKKHPEIGQMDAWVYLRSALRQVPCPCCIGRKIAPSGCRYCAGTGKIDYHLDTHPMNVFHVAQDMDGQTKENRDE